MRAIGAALAVVLWAAPAGAHGSAGDHESPAWCGDKLAVAGDSGVFVVAGGKAQQIAVATKTALVVWAPACDRLAIVGERAGMIELQGSKVRDFGAVPAPFARAMRMDGPLPSIRFSPSGARFAVTVVASTIGEEAIVTYDVAAGTSQKLAFPQGEVRAFAMLDDDTAVAAIRPNGASGVQLMRATASAATRVNPIDYQDGRTSLAPVAVGMMKPSTELVLVDPQTGAETSIAAKIEYLQAMSADGSHALAVLGSPMRTAAIDAKGVARPFDADIVFGAVSDEETAWTADGRITLAPWKNHTWAIDDGSGAPRVFFDPQKPGALGKAAGIGHVTLSADGKRAAFVAEIPEPGPRTGACDYESWGRADLFVSPLARVAPKKLATISRIHHCAVE